MGPAGQDPIQGLTRGTHRAMEAISLRMLRGTQWAMDFTSALSKNELFSTFLLENSLVYQ